MSVRQRKSPEYWKEVIEDFLKSGKTQKEYTTENKISRAAIWSWSKQLGIPLNQRKRLPKVDKVDKDPPLKFTDVQILGRVKVPSSL